MATGWAVDHGTPDQVLRSILTHLTYEVMPFKGTEEKVVTNVPATTRLTVTASPGKTLSDTVDLAERLTRHGYTVAPHLSARMLTDRAELKDLVDRCAGAGISSLFVVGGDADQAGEFYDALDVLRGLDEMGHHFVDIGVGGYPEGHAGIPDEALWRALEEKARYAHHIATQVCFDARTTVAWSRQVRSRGIDLPIRVGMPGAVSRQKLMRVTGKIGLGDSARFLKKQQGMLWKFFTPGGYSPNKLIRGLRPHLAEPDTRLRGFHIFTFNDVEGTEAWRRKLLDGLG
ncbi:methylenetetrahydrofolate reductase [Nocardioides cheoyonin]|uniref:methylenetetrahydrofolate reductase n=1 Tax=Nocardioides cheoyonin TaxID=3156615 RepID=UPI0032B32789